MSPFGAYLGVSLFFQIIGSNHFYYLFYLFLLTWCENGNFFFQELETTTLEMWSYVVNLLVWPTNHYILYLIFWWFAFAFSMSASSPFTHFTPSLPLLFLFSYFCLHDPEHLLFLPVPASTKTQSNKKNKSKTKTKNLQFLNPPLPVPLSLALPSYVLFIRGGV